jgi:sensor histidine kinase YesM
MNSAKANKHQIKMNYVLPNLFPSRKWAHQLANNFFIVSTINIFIAVFITYVVRTGLDFLGNLVFSFCIGYLMWLFLDAGRLMLWGTTRPPVFKFFMLCLVGIPTARILGSMIATEILGVPDKNLKIILEQGPLRFVIVTILISLFIIWLFWNRSKMACLIADAEAEKARIAAIEKQAMQAQLQLLQAQIEPHMLFNTLANVQALITIDAPRAQHMLDQLILYLRATLLSSRAEKTTLSHEFSLMEAYLELMSIRMGPRLKYSLQLPDNLRGQHIPPMLLQPLIENAIKHGLEPKVEGGQITVLAKQDGNMLHLSVTDTGLGLNGTSCSSNGTNIGLANIRERLRALYGDHAIFALNANTPTGVVAQLTLPLS